MSAQAQSPTLTAQGFEFVTMSGTALPTTQECRDKFQSSNPLSAYRVCLGLERAAQDTGDEKNVVCARILGYLLLFLPSDSALAEVAKVIHSCNTGADQYDKLFELGESFLHYFVRHCGFFLAINET